MAKTNLKKIVTRISNRRFIHLEQLYSRLSGQPALSILFSQKPHWQSGILRGFANTRHRVSFGTFTPKTIADHTLVVPLTMADLRTLGSHRELLRDQSIPIPTSRSIETCDDKLLFHQTLTALGYTDYLPRRGNDLSFPFLIKKRRDEAGANSHIVNTEAERQQLTEIIDNPEFFCEELIQGNKEYAGHVIIRNGTLHCALTVEHQFSSNVYIRGQVTSLQQRVMPCQYPDLFAEILKSLDYEGLCCFNYKIVNGQPKIFEINPRFGGSLRPYFFSFLRHLQ